MKNAACSNFKQKRERLGKLVYYGLSMHFQHRGQESCGIVVNDDGVFSSYKDLGLMASISEDTLAHLSEGNMAVGHVRYGTTGRNNRKNCQPRGEPSERENGAGT